jgi:hypothetical protein
MLLAFFFVYGWIEVPILLRPSSPDERVAPAKFYGPSVLCPHVKKLGQEGSCSNLPAKSGRNLDATAPALCGFLQVVTGRSSRSTDCDSQSGLLRKGRGSHSPMDGRSLQWGEGNYRFSTTAAKPSSCRFLAACDDEPGCAPRAPSNTPTRSACLVSEPMWPRSKLPVMG